MRNQLLFVLLVLLLALLGCQSEESSPTVGRIEGQIWDYQTSQPLSGVLISTIPATSQVMTAGDGSFSLTDLEPGIYEVRCSKSGYNNNSLVVEVTVDNTTQADMSMTPLGPQLSVNTSTLYYSNTSSQTLIVRNTGIGTLTWNLVANQPWVTITPSTGTTEGETDAVVVGIDRSVLGIGNHYAQITASSNANALMLDVMVNVPDPNGPQLTIVPPTLDFGESDLQLNATIYNTGTGTLNWIAAENQSWIATNIASGSTGASPSIVVVTVDRSNLTAGIHTGEVVFSSNGGSQTVAVNILIPDGPRLIVQPSQLHFDDDQLTAMLSVENRGSGILLWEITSKPVWLNLDSESGINGETINVTADGAGLDMGSHEGSIVFNSNGGQVELPVVLELTGLEAVELFTPSDITQNSMTLHWSVSGANDFNKYKLYRSSDDNVNTSDVLVFQTTSLSTTSYIDSNLENDTYYYYRIYVENDQMQLVGSNMIAARTLRPMADISLIHSFGGYDYASTHNPLYVPNDNMLFISVDLDICTKIGNDFECTEMETYYDIAAIHGTSQNNVYAVDDYMCKLFKYDGVQWDQIATLPENYRPRSIFAIGSDLWMINGNYWGPIGKIVKFVNGSYSTSYDIDLPQVYESEIQFVDNNVGYVACGSVARWNGIGWTVITEDIGATRIFGVSSTEFYVLRNDGNASVISKYVNNVETEILRSSTDINDFVVMESGEIWAVGDGGHVEYYNGTAWSQRNSSTNSDLYRIEFISSSHFYIAGSGGVLLEYAE